MVLEYPKDKSPETKNSISKYPRNEVNPFAVELQEKKITTKYRKSKSPDGKDLVHVTGQNGNDIGHMQLVQHHKVDDDKFIKIYIHAIGIFHDLTKTGMRVFAYLISRLKPKQDKVHINLEECMAYTGFKQLKSIYHGLADLIKNKVIARGYNEVTYFINPTVIFNGNRIDKIQSYQLESNK